MTRRRGAVVWIVAVVASAVWIPAGSRASGPAVSVPPYSDVELFASDQGSDPCIDQTVKYAVAATSGHVSFNTSVSGNCSAAVSPPPNAGAAALLTKATTVRFRNGEILVAVLDYEVGEAGVALRSGAGTGQYLMSFDLGNALGAEVHFNPFAAFTDTCAVQGPGSCSPTAEFAPGSHQKGFTGVVDCAGPRSCTLTQLDSFIGIDFQPDPGTFAGRVRLDLDVTSLAIFRLRDCC
jgi:hypothetical protein